MSHTLTNYNGLQIVTPEGDLSADRQALNDNFKILADSCLQTYINGGDSWSNTLGIVANYDGGNSITNVNGHTTIDGGNS